jgi:hypothetical protein
MTNQELDMAPRWVVITGIVALIAIVAFVVVHLTGLAPHGH